MSARSWNEVGNCIRARRVDLGLTQEEAARAGDVSVATWRLVETGGRDRYQELTMVGVARAMRWPKDAMTRLREGADPDALTADAPAEQARQPPVGLARRWSRLTTAEQARVEAFIDGILSTR